MKQRLNMAFYVYIIENSFQNYIRLKLSFRTNGFLLLLCFLTNCNTSKNISDSFCLTNHNNQFSVVAKQAGVSSVHPLASKVGLYILKKGGNAVVEPNKRMLSSMTPTIVLKNGEFFMALGTPSGTTIPTAVFQTIVAVIDYGMSAEAAVKGPKFHHEWRPDEVRFANYPQDSIEVLKRIGYKNARLGHMTFLEVIKRNRYNELEIASERGDAEGY